MALKDALLPEWDHEMGTTRRLLERVPAADFSWKPHDKSMSLGQLAGHVANLPRWCTLILDDSVLELASIVDDRRSREPQSVEALLNEFDQKSSAARANLATALYESKRYQEAIPEYEWIVATKPEVGVAHYFIATSHDYLGESPAALVSYEKFLSVADPKTNQLEIDKVKLRLPTLRRQIQLGEGVKKKP